MRIMSIDNSVVTYIAWHRMRNVNFRNRTGEEIVEFTRNYAEIMAYLQELYAPDKTIILMDCVDEVWRDKVQLEYYLEHSKAWNHTQNKERTIVMFDEKYYPLTFNIGQEGFTRGTALKQGEVKDIDWNDWDEVELEEHHIEFIPQYKGTRSSTQWLYKATKAEFKEKANAIGFSFAPLIDAVTLQQDHLEADDIAYMVVKQYPDAEHIMVTSDTDWQQLGRLGNVSFYDPRAHEFIQHSQEKYTFNFFTKLLGGDSSDNIPGAWMPNVNTGKLKYLRDKSAQNLINEVGLESIWDYMKSNKTPSLSRNLLLISMKLGFKYINKQYNLRELLNDITDKAVDNTDLTHEDFEITKVDLRLKRIEAKRDRAKLAATLEFNT